MAHREGAEVVFADVDMMGHVNNARYFTYFETARTNYYLKLAHMRPPFKPSQLDLIVAKATCEFKRGLTWGEAIETVVWPSRVGETSFTFRYAILDRAGKAVATGETVQVSFDYATNAKKPIPPAVRKALEAEAAAGPGVPGLETSP